MQLAEIRHNLTSRRNRIFLLMEEVRRLRIQQRLKVRCLQAFGSPFSVVIKPLHLCAECFVQIPQPASWGQIGLAPGKRVLEGL